MSKVEFITAVSVIFQKYPRGSVEIFDALSELYDEMARLKAAESQANNTQQLKSEILPILNDAKDEFTDGKYSHGMFYLDQIAAKLSAV